MTNPTLSWTCSTPATITIAGANPTVTECLAAINAAVIAVGAYWEVSAYSAGVYLELKRKVAHSPTGELATVRLLIFGGATPNAAALATSQTANTTTLYAALSVDANTTGPGTAYTAGAPYSTKYTKGSAIGVPGSGLTTANTVKLTLFESVDSFGFVLSDSTNLMGWHAGRIIVRGSDDSLVWGSMPTGTHYSASRAIVSMADTTLAHLMTPLSVSSASVKATYWDAVSASARQFGRVMAPVWANLTDSCLGASGAAAQLIPMPMGESSQTNGSPGTYLGVLRQVRMGPVAAHLQKIRDSSAVLQATHINGGTIAVGMGMWLDEVP